MSRECVSIDFDGVLHEHAGWRPSFGAVSPDLIVQAQERGYAVAVSTCNTTWRVADALKALGFRVRHDRTMEIREWHGGWDGTTVLVTGRKVTAVAYLDDRAVRVRYGDDPARALDEVAEIGLEQ